MRIASLTNGKPVKPLRYYPQVTFSHASVYQDGADSPVDFKRHHIDLYRDFDCIRLQISAFETLDEFRQSLTTVTPPAGLPLALVALCWDAKGDWQRAHESAQQDEGPDVHGCVRIFIAKKAIKAMQPTGMGVLASRLLRL